MALKGSSPAFTLRFRRKKTHEALRHAADELGVSMNEIAERAIEHELDVIGTDLEQKLRRTVELLRSHRGESLEADIEAFARAEVEEEDPLRSRTVQEKSDRLEIGALFADPVE